MRNNPRRAATAVEYGLIAGGILLAIILGVTHAGISLANLFGGMSNSAVTASTQMPPVLFAQNCGPAAAQTNVVYGYGWSFPSYACGVDGINGPSGPVKDMYTTGGSDWYQIGTLNSQGSLVPYDLKMSGTNGPALGDMFLDGYSFSAALVQQTGISFSQWSAKCSAGGVPVENLFPYPVATGNNTVYARGTPYKTAGGDFICGNTSIVSGSQYIGGYPGI